VLQTLTTDWITETSEGYKHLFFDGVGMPLYANTYRKKMIPMQDEQWTELQNTDPGEIPEGEELITADPSVTAWPTSWTAGGPSRYTA
jgi:hypothetical protein